MTDWRSTSVWVTRSDLADGVVSSDADCGCAYRISEKNRIEVASCDSHTDEQACDGAVDRITENTDMTTDIETGTEAVDYE